MIIKRIWESDKLSHNTKVLATVGVVAALCIVIGFLFRLYYGFIGSQHV